MPKMPHDAGLLNKRGQKSMVGAPEAGTGKLAKEKGNSQFL
jgi:hypothetical protein